MYTIVIPLFKRHLEEEIFVLKLIPIEQNIKEEFYMHAVDTSHNLVISTCVHKTPHSAHLPVGHLPPRLQVTQDLPFLPSLPVFLPLLVCPDVHVLRHYQDVLPGPEIQRMRVRLYSEQQVYIGDSFCHY